MLKAPLITVHEEKFENGTFQSHDGLNLFYRYYKNPAEKNTILLLHGHGEHTGRYTKFIDYLENEGLSIAMYDARGHGRSEGPVVYLDSYEDFIKDVDAFLDFLKREKNINGKIFLFGHSNGGLISYHWASRNPERLKALFLSSPCWGLHLPPFLVKLNRWLNSWAPKFIYGNPVYPPYLTHNLEEVERYKKDVLIRRKISVRLLDEMIKYSDQIDSAKPWVTSFPVYILMSGLDKVVDGEKTKKVYEKIEAPDKALHSFEGFYHEIFNEKGQEEVFAKFLEYLRKVN